MRDEFFKVESETETVDYRLCRLFKEAEIIQTSFHVVAVVIESKIADIFVTMIVRRYHGGIQCVQGKS